MEWGCGLEVAGLETPKREIRGVDSFQCLVLALRLARVLMQHAVDMGGQYFYAKDGEPLSIDDLFGSGELGRI